MPNDRKRSTDAHPEVVSLLRRIRSGEAVAGVHEFKASGHDDLMKTVNAIDPAEADVAIVVDGLTASVLGQCSEAICDLAVEANAPVVFRHRGEVLQLSRVEDWPPRA